MSFSKMSRLSISHCLAALREVDFPKSGPGYLVVSKADDALRIKVTPQAAEPQEALQYSFPTATNDATQLVLHWEKVKVAFTISADTEAMTKAKARKVFNSTEAWWAANYYYRAKTDLEEGCAGSMLCWR